MSSPSRRAEWTDVELLDAGDGRRLERFGRLVVDRPAPTAREPRRDPGAWADPGLRFDAAAGWTGPLTSGDGPPGAVAVRFEGLDLELRPTSSGGIGLYPEHAAGIRWLEDRLAGRRRPSVLNLFAHTGLLTLAAARAGAAVAHVDAARAVVAWARRNAELSHLADRPIRWLVDDATAFAAREVRRGRRYDGIVLDPPSFGHAGGRRWRLEHDLPGLLEDCADLLRPGGFVLLTAHTTGLDGADMAALVRAAWPGTGAQPDSLPLELTATSGARLRLGWAVRLAAR